MPMNNYELRLGLQYLGSTQKTGFLSVMAWITVLGIFLGVLALVVALSFASGFQSTLRDKIIGVNAHLLLLRSDGNIEDWKEMQERIEGMPGVATTMPFTYHQGLVRSDRNVAGTIIRGILPRTLPEIAGSNLSFVCGELDPIGTESIWLGKVLAETLEVSCDDSVRMVALSGRASVDEPAKLKDLHVAGIFEVGMYEYDSSLAFLALPVAQEFFGIGDRVTGIEIRLKDIETTEQIRSSIQQTFGYPFWIKTWSEINPNFFAALRLQKIVMFLILILIVVVGGFNIISTLIMSVIDKRREIAILKAMGATARSIRRIFFFQGVVLGTLGVGLGLIGGYVLCRLIGAFPLIRLDPDVYYLSYLPVEVCPEEFLVVGMSAMVLVVVATVYPARQAAKLHPAEVLRHE